MRVFLAGGSGVIGRLLIPALVAGGHDVTAITRRPERVAAIEAAGATAVVCDALHARALREAVVAATPEAIIHHLTDLPAAINPRKMKELYVANNELRRRGTPNLIAAARAAGAARIVAQSITFIYAPGNGPADERTPLYFEAPEPFDTTIAVIDELESAVTGTEGIEGVALRFGVWYGPGTTFAADGPTAELIRKRRFPITGAGDGVYSFCHVTDAVAATIAGLSAAPGIYNVCDDDPAPIRDWLPLYADAIGAPAPRKVPAFVGRLVTKGASRYFDTMRGASNAKAKADLGWSPLVPSWRHGFREALG